MIRAAIVGMGWWGRTLVEAVADSDQIRFVAGRHAYGVTGGEGVQRDAAAKAGRQLRGAARRQDHRCGGARDAALAALGADDCRGARWGSTSSARSPSRCTRPMRKRRSPRREQAGVTLGLGYNRRFHPEMTKLRQQIQSGALGTLLHFEATMTFPNALFLKAEAWRADKEETPCGGLTPMGVHAIDGMIDLGGADRAGLLSELPPRRPRRQRRHDVDALPHEERRVGLPRHDHRDRARLQLPGVWLEGVRAPRRHDARRGRLVGRAPHAPLQHGQVSTDQGPGRGLGRRAPRRHARHASTRLRRRPPAARRI